MKTAESKSIQQYLNNYSHAIDLGLWPSDCCWDHVLLIPVCGEPLNFLQTVMKHQYESSVLVILLVNLPLGHAKTDQWQAENSKLNQHLTGQAKTRLQITDKHTLLLGCLGVDLLLLDFNDAPFPEQQGVGLARRIAADTALRMIDSQVIKQPWIFSTDADVVLPMGYFAVICQVPENTSAISLPFDHTGENQPGEAEQQQYDFKLRYYQHAMTFIGSPYNYIPLGSTLVIHAASYAKVRGFPKRSGGEDFYLLNKLAKVGVIEQPREPVVEIKIRFSERVPFGTGPAITQIRLQNQADEAVLYYHPKIFHVIKDWRRSLTRYFQTRQKPTDDQGLNDYWQLDDVLTQSMVQIKSEVRWLQFVDEWLDAFKLLKSVHFLRTKYMSLSHDELMQMTEYTELFHKH